MRTGKRALSAGVLLAAVMTLLGGVPATAAVSNAPEMQPRETTAPKCMHDKESKGKVYTTVWVTNKCKRNYRIKLIMARGADSRCFSIAPGQTRKHESRGVSSYLDRIVLC